MHLKHTDSRAYQGASLIENIIDGKIGKEKEIAGVGFEPTSSGL